MGYCQCAQSCGEKWHLGEILLLPGWSTVDEPCVRGILGGDIEHTYEHHQTSNAAAIGWDTKGIGIDAFLLTDLPTLRRVSERGKWTIPTQSTHGERHQGGMLDMAKPVDRRPRWERSPFCVQVLSRCHDEA